MRHALDFFFMLIVTGAAFAFVIWAGRMYFKHRGAAVVPTIQPKIVRDGIDCEGGNRLGVEYWTRNDGRRTFMVRLSAERPMMTLTLFEFWRQMTELMDRAASREPGRVVQSYDCDDCRAEFKYASLTSSNAPRFCPNCGKDSSRVETAVS